jgi:putative DNA primase/helicase
MAARLESIECLPDLIDGENDHARFRASPMRWPPSGGSNDMTAAPSLRVLPITDLDTARCFADKFKGKLYHVHAWKSWVSWDGSRWARDPDEKVVRQAMSLADDYELEAREEQIPDRRAKLFKLAGHLSKGKTIREMITLARAIMPKASEDFDKDPTLLNTPFGTVHLPTGDHLDNYPLHDISKSTTVAYDPEATCPTWDRFLHTIMGGNTALMEFLQRAVGYSLTGSTKERKAFILYGSGRNGKSTFLRTIQTALGDYATTASSNLIMAGRDEKTYNDLAALRGTRFVAASESGKGKAMDTGIFKLITGDENISARFLYGEWFTFRPQFKLWLATNHRPDVDADDQALWDRIRLIPFTVRIPDSDVDDGS